MNIAVNTRLLIKDRLDGMGWFSYETLKRITLAHPEHQFYFLFDRPYNKEFIFSANITPVVLPPPSRHPILWFLWLEVSVHRFLRKNKMDVFVSPDGFMPLRTSTPVVNVIHDINFFHRPADLPFFSRNYYNFFFPRFAKNASRVGTVSEYSATDISQSYEIERSKIDIYHNGVNDIYNPISEEQIKIVRNNISGGFPYFIFVGTLHPRKNVANLLRAYDNFMSERKPLIKMVIVGEKMFLTSDIQQVLKGMKYKDYVIFTGRLSPGELHKVMAASLAMTFIPYFEGFGIPVIEAMKCGIPVITSNVTSLPEVGGDAVLYSDPDDVEKTAVNMGKIADNENLRKEYSEKGLERVEQFSWDHTAEKFWKSIEKVLHGA